MSEMFKPASVREFSFKRLLLSILIVPVLIYIGLGVYAYYYADRLIFQPQPPSYHDVASITKITTPGGEKISALYLKNPDAKYTILFSHGNAEDLGNSYEIGRAFNKAGFSFLAYDYRGYGTSEGSPSEQNAYEDIETVYNYLTGELQIPADNIIIQGRSLGGAVSIDLASRKPCAGLIAESTFVTAFRVMTGIAIYPFDKFKNIEKIKQVNCPILFIHGKKDGVVPFRHGEMLFAAANEPKYNYWIDQAGHNDIFANFGKVYIQSIQDFSAKLSK
jgi:fermentation-respiration switch protein FrsA (DUF1100 family)